MKFAGFALALVGAVVGFLTGLLEHGNLIGHELAAQPGNPQVQMAYVTLAVSVLGALGAFVILFRPRAGAAISLFVTVVGVFGAYVLWEFAGSFFLVAALLGFAVPKGQDAPQGS